MSKKVELQFMVVPEQLSELAYVPDAIRCRVIDPEAIFLTGLLGESGRKLVLAGIEFYFAKPLAEKLIRAGIAQIVTEEAVTGAIYEDEWGNRTDPPAETSHAGLRGII